MSPILKTILVITIILCVDITWITFNKAMYIDVIERVQKRTFKLNVYAAAVTYVLVITGVVFIAVPLAKHAMKERADMSIAKASALYGGMTGLVTYGIYNFTSMSIYSDYTLKVAAVDTLWGCLIFSISTYLLLLTSN